MSTLLREVEDWFLLRPKWLQDAASRLVRNCEINSVEILDLIELCKSEVVFSAQKKFNHIPSGSLKLNEGSKSLRLNKISNVKGINALEPRNDLSFEKGSLSIIFGQNGSGKSSYVRMLKHACGAKKPGKLLNNVFKNSDVGQECTYSITIDSEEKDITWSPAIGILEDLKLIELYDSDCGNVYVNEENEITYEPWLLSLFTQLTEVCQQVGQAIKDESDQYISKKPDLPKDFLNTKGGLWFSKLNFKTTEAELTSNCTWKEDEELELNQIKQRLAENNPLEKANNFRKVAQNANSLHEKLKKLKSCYDNGASEIYFLAKAEAIAKRKAADEDAIKVFEGSPLDGIGTESWKFLWEQARLYSEKIAYPDQSFPFIEEDSRCVLCQQSLNLESKTRLSSFEQYVKGELSNQALNAEKKLTQILESKSEIPSEESINLLLDAININKEEDRLKFINYCKLIENRRQSFIEAIELADVTRFPDDTILIILTELEKANQQQAAAYDSDSKEENRDNLNKKVNEIEAKKWLFQQKKSIEEELTRLKIIQKLKEAHNLTNTQSLSTKKSSLSDELITFEYTNRFQQELNKLGGSRIKVEMVKTKAQKGHIYHQVRLLNCSPLIQTADILSEGEFRIVSLAGFLADVEGRPNNTPFIFDDPISSLDQDFEEATVKRLIQLSETRQVIVFTHRLSLLTLLEEGSKDSGLQCDVICLRAESWGMGEPGDTPLYGKKPINALNALLNERLSRARKIYIETGREEYELIAKGLCSDFRILIERFIENELLADVVQRFRRSIKTMGIIHKLGRIRSEDCSFFDEQMTKYSKYEHSQSYEAPVILPDPDELQKDFESLKAWFNDFNKREAS